MAKVSKEQAIDEINGWLKFKGYDQSEIEEQKETVEAISEHFEAGRLYLDDNIMVQTLRFPIMEKEDTSKTIASEIRYKPNPTMGELNKQMSKFNNPSTDDKILGAIKASSNIRDIFIDRMNVKDYRVAQAVNLFLVY